MENIVVKRWLRRFGVSIALTMAAIFAFSTVVFAVGSITDFIGIPTSTTVSLTWVKSSSTDNTVVRYSTTSYPATYADGTSAYNGTASYTKLTGLSSGTNYYFSAFAFDGSSYSAAVQRLVTTLSAVAENTTIPYTHPAIPTEAWQNPSTTNWTIHPIDDILAYFADPTNAHGGLGMPTDNLVMFIASVVVTGTGLFSYIKWRNFFAAYVIVFILSFFCVAIHVMQGYVIGLEILIGAGVWAIDKNFQ